MRKHFSAMILLAALNWPVFAVEERPGVVVGEVLKLDAVARTVVVKSADGTSHAFRFLERTAVHRGRDLAAGSKDVFRGLREGSQVAVRYTVKGTEETVEEVKWIGSERMD